MTAELYGDIFEDEASDHGLNVNLSAFRQGCSAVVERHILPLAKLTGKDENAAGGDEDVDMYGDTMLRQMGHSARMADSHYAGGKQQLDRITRNTVLLTSILTCGEFHTLIRPQLRSNSEWRKKWGSSSPAGSANVSKAILWSSEQAAAHRVHLAGKARGDA